VRANPLLVRYAGTPGAKIVVRPAEGEAWIVHEGTLADEVDVSAAEAEAGRKRALSTGEAGDTKRLRLDDAAHVAPASSAVPSAPAPAPSPCLAPAPDAAAARIFARLAASPLDASLGAGDVFLTDGFRERWCACAEVRAPLEPPRARTDHPPSQCIAHLTPHPYLVSEEETYAPPDDADAPRSLEELGMRALARLPRERALDGIRAFNGMRCVLFGLGCVVCRRACPCAQLCARALCVCTRIRCTIWCAPPCFGPSRQRIC
jgi:E3 ubiquitin-protein ligase UBR7